MAQYTVKPDQNIWDVALHLYGSVEGVFDLMISNPGLSLDVDLKYGDTLEYHDFFVINEWIVNKFNELNITPANSERKVYYKKINQPIKFIYRPPVSDDRTEFTISGSGNMFVDWGDNSEIEIIALTSASSMVEHYFDNTVDERIVKVYGDFLLNSLDISKLNTSITPVVPLVVDELISQSNGNSLQGLFLMEGTYSVNLQGSLINDLTPIGDMNLETLDLRNVQFSSISVLDDYLTYIVENYGTRRACTVYLSTEPSSVGYDAIDTIINEDEWNQYESWSFIINGTEYVPN